MNAVNKSPRKRKSPKYKSFKLKKRIDMPKHKKLPSIFWIIKSSFKIIWSNKRVVFGMSLIYVVLHILLVKELSSSIDIQDIKNQLASIKLSGVDINMTLLGLVAGSSAGGVNEIANLYQTILAIVHILAFIWLFRQLYADNEKKSSKKMLIRSPYYEGMTPFIPFILVLFVIGLQFIPMFAGLSLFGVVQQNGLASTGLETFIWGLLALLLSLLSLYLISSSVFALIIVTLPRTKPIQALRAAKKLVTFRRFVLLRKLFYLLIFIGLVYSSFILLIIVTIPFIAEWSVVILNGFMLPLIIGAIYKLYRELL